MSRRTVTLSGEVLDRIFEYVSTTGEPLLRDRRDTDAGIVSAWRQEDGSYELVDTGDWPAIDAFEAAVYGYNGTVTVLDKGTSTRWRRPSSAA